MKATNYSMEDDRGLVSLMFQLVYAALMPSAREAWDGPVSTPKLGLFERFDRWASDARQRDRDRFPLRTFCRCDDAPSWPRFSRFR